VHALWRLLDMPVSNAHLLAALCCCIYCCAALLVLLVLMQPARADEKLVHFFEASFKEALTFAGHVGAAGSEVSHW
jgi:hypothetical protein